MMRSVSSSARFAAIVCAGVATFAPLGAEESSPRSRLTAHVTAALPDDAGQGGGDVAGAVRPGTAASGP